MRRLASALLAITLTTAPTIVAAQPSAAADSMARVNDGNPDTYWTGQAAQVDLGSATSISGVTLKLPARWEARTQHLSVLGSFDGHGYSTLVGAKDYRFTPEAGNTVRIDFAPTVTRIVEVQFPDGGQLGELRAEPTVQASPDLAAGRTMSASGFAQNYVAGNANDGNQGTYWESANNAFPQWLQVDLGSAQSAGRIVLQLPAGWGQRTQTLSVLGSTNGTTFSTVVGSAGYSFAPGNNNTVTITFTPTTQRYFRLNITANTGWIAGQISSFEVWNN
jgi:hypothetical protein